MAQVEFDDFVAGEAERLGEVLGAVFEAQDDGLAQLVDGFFAFFFGYGKRGAFQNGNIDAIGNQAVECFKVFAFYFEVGVFFPAGLGAFAVGVLIARGCVALHQLGFKFAVLGDFVELVEFLHESLVDGLTVFAFCVDAEMRGHGIPRHFHVGGFGKFNDVVVEAFCCYGQGGG